MEFNELVQLLNHLYPPSIAEDWDQVGTHFMTSDRPVKTIMTALDVRPQVLEEAIAHQVDTLVVHHPPIFSPIQRLDNANPQLKMYADLVKNKVNVFAMHTNLDMQVNGMNDWLAEALDLEEVQVLEPLEDKPEVGLGRIGNLPKALKQDDLFDYIKNKLRASNLTYIEKVPKESYQKIAIVGGSSFNSIYPAIEQGAHVFITGDITYHKGHDAYEEDILTIDPGHYIEHIFIEKMADILEEELPETIFVRRSQVNTNPFKYY